MLYAGSTPLVCFVETLARFRRPFGGQEISAVLDQIKYADADHTAPGTVPGSWLRKRKLGTTLVEGRRYADVYSSEWMSYLSRELEAEIAVAARRHDPRQPEFDLALLMSRDRSLTQKIASLIYALEYDGIYYQSRHGSDLRNWALFEPFQLVDSDAMDLSPNDPDFREAVRRLGLQFDPGI